MKTVRFAFLACVATIGLAAPAHADRDTPQFTSLTVFGDSLVDAGNVFVATGGTTPSPALGYFQGRFTNGYDYTDLLSISLFGTPTAPSLVGGNNFAWGGARIVSNAVFDPDVPLPLPDLQLQLGMYQQRLATGGSVDLNGLYVMNFGGNDIFNAADSAAARGITVNDYLALAATEYAAGVQALNDLGARNILVTGFPVATDPNSITAEGIFLQRLSELDLDEDTTLFNFSYLSFFQTALTDPGSIGLPPLNPNPAQNCIALGLQEEGCPGVFFFDGTHPVAAVHEALYREMDRQFGLTAGAVPEPASWGMMIIGFGLIGGALRRRPSVNVSYA